MTLRRRTLLLITLALLGLAAGVYLVLGSALRRGFAELEARQARRDLQRGRQALSEVLADLSGHTERRANERAFHLLAADAPPESWEAALSLPALRGYRIDVVAVISAGGTLLRGWRQTAGGTAAEPLPEGLRKLLGPGGGACPGAGGVGHCEGFVALPEGPLALVTRTLPPGGGSDPEPNVLVLGRFIDAGELARLAASWQVELAILAADDPAVPPGVLDHPPSGQPEVVRPVDDETVAAWAPLTDITGSPALVVRATCDRELGSHARHVIRLVAAALLATVACFGLLAFFIVERLVLSRLSKLDKGIEAIAATGDVKGRVLLPGEDEVTHLASEINTMLAAVEITGKQLQESEARYRKLVELSPDGIVILSDGKVVFGNRKSADLIGVTEPLGVFGQPAFKFVHPRSRRSIARAAARLRDYGEPMLLRGEKLIRVDGVVVDVDIAAAPHTFEGHAAVQVVVRDVTGRRQLEEQLVQAQKMEAVGRLAGGVAHDFNNILQVILSLSQSLRVARPGTPAMTRALDELDEHVRRAAALTRRLLVFARRDVTVLEVLDLNELVSQSADMLRRLLRENIQLKVKLHETPLPVQGDPKRLEQVLLNLAVNASDAMSDGGRLTITTSRIGEEAVALEVRDTGVGIPEDLRERIFEPFFTTKASEHGTGLGLSVVHAIVGEYGGMVAFDTEVGAGSTFRVLLPRSASPLRRSPHQLVEDTMPTGAGERVLVVEDETAAREGLREVLTMLGYQVVTASSGEEAEALPDQPPFDVLLTDHLLPGVKGNVLAHRLRHRWPRLKVIAMSGYAPDGALQQDIAELAFGFLQKPFDMATLAREIRGAISGVPDTARQAPEPA